MSVRRPNSVDSPRLQRLVVVNADGVRVWRTMRGVSDTDFCERCGLSKATYYRMKRGNPVELSTAQFVASAMGLSDVREILVDGNVGLSEASSPPLPLAVDEWDIAAPMEDSVKASNGLTYRVCQMRNRNTPTQLGRGKCYDFEGVYDQERDRVITYCKRHSDVCRKVGSHPNLPLSYRSSPDPTGRFWWIIDPWPNGRILAEQLQGSRWPVESLKPLMMQLASGLQALHAVDVVRRELAPRNIVFDANSRHAVLTDFELGKLLDTSITVSKGPWPVDAYRAPEVGKGRATKAADYFSWGRVFVHAATGSLPDNGKENANLRSLVLPRGLREFVGDCVQVIPQNRPQSFDAVLKILANWV